MDQAESLHQEVLRHFIECAQDSNLDRHFGLRARRHCQKTTGPGSHSLQNFKDPERHNFRESAHFRRPFFIKQHDRRTRSFQTTDSIRLTLGQ